MKKNSYTAKFLYGVIIVIVISVLLPAAGSRTWAKEQTIRQQNAAPTPEALQLQTYFGQEILSAHEMADLSAKTKTFSYDSERQTRWTDTIGVSSAEICDLDGDGQEELLLTILSEKKMTFSVYEVENGVVTKTTEISIGRCGDMSAYEEILTLIYTEQGYYLLLTQKNSGLMEDFYYATMELYRYDGDSLYMPMAIIQTDGGSDDFSYMAFHCTNQGKIISSELIYGRDENERYLDDKYHCARMKELFADYGIRIGEQCHMVNYKDSFADFIEDDMDAKVLMKLCMWGESINDKKDQGVLFHFNDEQISNEIVNDANGSN